MGRVIASIGTAALIAMLAAGPASAQSSGSFAAKLATTQCAVNADGSLTDGIGVTLLQANIKTPNSGLTALLVRPSLVSGLFTKTRITQLDTDGAAVAGVQVRVLIDGKVVAPGTPVGKLAEAEDGWVYYDKRFQQLSSNLFGQIETCGVGSTTECFLELVLSTLSAHSMDFVVGDVGGGDHTLTMEWRLLPSTPTANEKACVGPGVLTVTQVKTFKSGDGIIIVQ